MANIGFISLGCAKNQVDCERMMYRVQEAGHTVQAEVAGCDVVVINTCGFIDSAKSEAIDYILKAAAMKEAGLVGKILVTGCLSQRYRGEVLKELPEVDGILGTGSYTEIVPAIERLLDEQGVEEYGSIDAPEQETGRILTTPEHYAYIKIAEGCDNHCAYCVIPSLRGRYRSRQMDDVLYEARMLAAQGVKELIVVAQDTSRYGTDLPGHRRLLPELLRRLCEVDGLHWIRVHYVYPDEIDDELLEVMASEPKIVKYLDIPIQHCNSEILKRMNRRGDGAPGEDPRSGDPHQSDYRPARRGGGGVPGALRVPAAGAPGTGGSLRLLSRGGYPRRRNGACGFGNRSEAGRGCGNAPVGDYG